MGDAVAGPAAPAREFVVEADGGSRGNPGPAGYGAVVLDAVTGETLVEAAEYLGVATNNVAEYRGLLAGLRAARELDPEATVRVRMDSKLVVEQMSGRWKIKHPDMKPLAAEAARVFPPGRVTYEWMPRASNKHADRLANEAMDAGARGERWSPSGSTADLDAGDARAAAAAEAPAVGEVPAVGEAPAVGAAPGDPAASEVAAPATATDASARDASARDASARDASARVASARDASARVASAPDASARVASAPDASAPDASAPDASAPVASARDATAAVASARDATAAVASARDASAPVASARDASAPDASAPDASAPDASAPDASAPDASARDASAPVASARDASAPDASAPDASAPDASAPDAPARVASAPDAPARVASAPDASAPQASVSDAAATADVRAAKTVASPGWGPPDMGAPATFVLLRHGETPLTPQKRFSGSGGSDPSLSAAGREQAEKVAASLARRGTVQAVVASPLARTRETARIVAARLGLEVTVEEGLRETDFGAWEGLTFGEVRERYPDDLNAWLSSPDAEPTGGGESFAATGARVAATRDKLVAAYGGRTVLLVSHVTPIKTFVRLALGAPPESLFRMELSAASLSAVAYYADGGASVRLFNDTSHLR
ncbi:bifunctional RNase H/acid phosphatase [Streptomyces sp. H72]